MYSLTVLALLSVILAGPVYVGDREESLADREERLRPWAAAIVEVSGNDVPLAAGLLELAEDESSNFARYIVEGRCLEGPWKCDPHPRTGLPRARGPWQVWGWCRRAWKLRPGTAASALEEARCARRQLLGAKTRCAQAGRDPWVGAFSGYASKDCSWAPAEDRAKGRRRLEARIWLAIGRG